MKASILAIMSFAISMSAFALESGNYINKDFSSGDPALYKSLNIDTSKCEKGGAIVKFYNADAMNFCIGNTSESVFKFKKCIGKELPFPLGHCIGIKKTVTMKTIKKVVSDETKGIYSLVETNLTDDQVTFTQTYQLTDINGAIRVEHSFKSNLDDRNGKNEFLFERAN